MKSKTYLNKDDQQYYYEGQFSLSANRGGQVEPHSFNQLISPSFCPPKVRFIDPEFSINDCHANQIGLVGKWKTSSLLIISMVMRFVIQMKTKIDSTKLKMVTQRMFELIGDAASDYEILNQIRGHKMKLAAPSLINSCQQFITNSITHTLAVIDEIIPIMKTNSILLLLFQLIMVVTLLINLFYVPIYLSFFSTETSVYWQTIPNIIFTLWIGVCCNTQNYHDEVLQTDRKSIIQGYYRNELIYDFLIVFPYYFRPLLNNYAELTFVLKVFQLQRILEKFEYNNNFKENITAIFDLIKLIIFLLFITHCCACAWHFLGIYERDQLNIQSNWLDFYNYIDNPWLDRYIISLYWSVITTLTVGYGDISPQTQLERLYVIFVAMILCGLLGYTVTSIGEIFKSINDKKMIYKQQMKAVNKLVKQRGLNTQLQIKVRKYFQHLFLREQEENNLGEQLMAKLTPNLEEEVLIDTYRKILKQSVLLKHFKDVTIDKLCTKVNIAQYAPGNEIIKCQTQSVSILFLLKGKLSVVAHNTRSNIQLKEFSPGIVIGEQEFAEHAIYDYSIISMGYSKVAYITRKDFLKVLSLDSQEIETICQLRDNCVFNPDYKNIVGRACEVCGWTHGYLQCPFVFIQFDKWKIIRTHNQSYDNSRKSQQRRFGKLNSRRYRTIIEEACIQYGNQAGLWTQTEDEQGSKVSKISNSIKTPFSSSNGRIDESSKQIGVHSKTGRQQSYISIKALDCEKRQANLIERLKRQPKEYFEQFQSDQQEPHLQQTQSVSKLDQNTEYLQVQFAQIQQKLAEITTIQQINNYTDVEQEQKNFHYDEFETPQNYVHYKASNNMSTIVPLLIQGQLLMSPVKSNQKRQSSRSLRTIRHDCRLNK